MKNPSSVLILLLMAFGSILYAGESPDSLFIAGKTHLAGAVNSWDITELMAARSYFERLADAGKMEWLSRYYTGLASNRIVQYYLGQNDKKQARRFVDDAIGQLERSIELKDSFAESYALLSNLLGTKIGLKPILGMRLGAKSGVLMSKAMQLDPNNPRVLLISGQNAFYTPKMFGGGKNKSMEKLTRAVACFDTATVQNPVLPEWGHEEAHAWLGRLYAEQENFPEAEAHYLKALEINPGYGWVKFMLFPELRKKQESEK